MKRKVVGNEVRGYAGVSEDCDCSSCRSHRAWQALGGVQKWASPAPFPSASRSWDWVWRENLTGMGWVQCPPWGQEECKHLVD